MALLCLLSWIYLVEGAGTGMSSTAMSTLDFPPPAYSSRELSWSWTYTLIMVAMWWVMMIAMMVPSAAPMILLYARVYRHHSSEGDKVAPTAAFLAGYLISWLLFSIAATALQWLLEQAGLVHSMMMWSSNQLLSAAFLLLAGAYQFSPLKQSCLLQCRSPAAYLSSNWLPGAPGALQMGFRHGLFCVGCCWSLMLLLFVGGVMNLFWIAGLALLVLLEKLLPAGALFSRLSGTVILGAGVYLLLA
jgi:predicted metal-binding membrane protein